MRKRQKVNQRKSKKLFTATAAKMHPKNVRVFGQRGGIRL